MKKALRILLIVVLSLIGIIAIAAAIIHFRGIPSYEVNAPDLTVEYTPERIAKGERLVSMVCSECHRGTENNQLTGKKLLDIPKDFGIAYSANITQDDTHGIGKYTDGEIAYVLRTGIKKNGEYCPPYMPKFPHMSDEDIYGIIAYLRSDAAPVQAVAKASIPSEPSFLTKLLCNIAFKPLPYPTQAIVAPPIDNQVEYGKYVLQGMVNCYDCHSADFKTNNSMEPEKSVGYLGGGNPMLNLDGEVVYAPNITLHETGIGHYTEEEFIRAVKQGVRPDGSPILYPMLKLTAFEDEELAAVWAYLQTVPKIDNAVASKE
jgi:mono/diheme cytochrome c family protein